MSRGAVGGGHKVGLARVARKAGPWWGGLGEALPHRFLGVWFCSGSKSPSSLGFRPQWGAHAGMAPCCSLRDKKQGEAGRRGLGWREWVCGASRRAVPTVGAMGTAGPEPWEGDMRGLILGTIITAQHLGVSSNLEDFAHLKITFSLFSYFLIFKNNFWSPLSL